MHVTENSLKNNPGMVENIAAEKYLCHIYVLKTYIE
jgi:hypothetical protein